MATAVVDPFDLSPRLARECWAKELGGCSDKLSKEHVISDAAVGDVVQFVTADGTRRTIGSGSLTISVLCSTHNSALSQVDKEGAKLINAVRSYRSTPLDELLLSPGAPAEYRVEIDGHLFERWAIKTFLNATAASSGLAKGSLQPLIAVHGGHVRDYVFGHSRDCKGAGLYLLNPAASPAGIDRHSKQLRIACMSDDVELRLEDNSSKGSFRFPVFGYFNVGGIELGMLANITTLAHHDWQQIVTDIACGRALATSKLRPPQILARPLVEPIRPEPMHAPLVISFTW